jgi:hypothetical protein
MVNVFPTLMGLLLSCWFPAANAAPFLYSYPWLAGSPQPTSCSYQEGSDSTVTAPVAVNADSSVYCKFDLADVMPAPYAQVHHYKVWANNALSASPAVTFSYHAEALAPPSGISIGP